MALVTTHLPIAKVAGEITTEKILEKLELFNKSLIQDFGIVKPRIAVLALNPHSGEGGMLGSEENDVIAPAIGQAVAKKSWLSGLMPPTDFSATECILNSTGCWRCIMTRDSRHSRPLLWNQV